MGIGTFGSFTQARLAIYASHMGLNVTGNNIANINTTGYTRQKLDQESFRVGGADRYHSSYNIRVGNGVMTTGVSQLRDPYLDIRYRSEMSSVGAMDAKLGGLENIQAILDEVGDGDDSFGIIEAQLSDLYNALQQLSDQTGHAEYDIQVRSSAKALAKQLNSYATKLEEVRNNTETAFKQDLDVVNGILSNIRDLNAAIRKNELHGDNALEMKDERNMLIDQLSEFMKIDVTYVEEDIGAGQKVDKLVIKLANTNPDSGIRTDTSTLVDGIYATQLKIADSVPRVNPNYNEELAQVAEGRFGKYMLDPRKLPPDADPRARATNDPSLALPGENTNLLLSLSPLTAVNGDVMKLSHTLKNTLIDKAKYDAEKDTAGTVTHPNGTVTITEYHAVTNVTQKGDPATLDGAAAAIPNWKLTNLVSKIKEIAGAAEAAGAVDGSAVTVSYDAATKTMQLMAGDDKVVGSSEELTFPLDKKVYFYAEDGSYLGSMEPETAIADKSGMPAANTPIGFTYKAPTANQTETQYYQSVQTIKYSIEIPLDDNDMYGALQSERELLTEAGEFTSAQGKVLDENAASKRGIPYYQKALDALANQLATKFNEANQGFVYNEKGEYVRGSMDENGVITPNPTDSSFTFQYEIDTLPSGRPIMGTYTLNKNDSWEDIPDGVKEAMWNQIPQHMQDEMPGGLSSVEEFLSTQRSAIELGGPLFSNRGDLDDTTNITAANISISDSWSKGPMIVSSYELPTGMTSIPSTAGGNIEHMIHMFSEKMEYLPSSVADGASNASMFNGTFQEMWVNIGSVLGNDMKVTSTLLDTYNASSVNLDTNRMGVSGVDLNDEAMNLMQYSQSYNAACRLMTTLDSVLDKLINGTGIT